MPESGDSNIEIVRHLHEQKLHQPPPQHSTRVHQVMEVIEAFVLALVAITTAWSGYQAARWDSVQSELYGESSRLRIEGQALSLSANQEQLYEALTVMEWIKADSRGEKQVAEIFENRLLPEFRPVFEEWKKLDPLHNPKAPVGPMLMPSYRSSRAEKAADMNQHATQLFEQGTRARERADSYVRVTVFLATVLLLTAISQRFRSHRIRVALITMAFLMLCYPIWRILTLPMI
jgi:hypothetical protein